MTDADRDLMAQAFACIEALRHVVAHIDPEFVSVGDDYDEWARRCIEEYQKLHDGAVRRATEMFRLERWGRDCLNVAERMASVAMGDHSRSGAHHKQALADLADLKGGPRRGIS